MAPDMIPRLIEVLRQKMQHALHRNPPLSGGWASLLFDDGHVHVIPILDHIDHEPSDECPCGPQTEPVGRHGGSYGWLVVHYSLDNREALEEAA